MLDTMKRRNIDLLIEQFWKHGYTTVSRKYGTYLPEPSKIGEFDVDIVARFKKDYAIGITLSEPDLNAPNILDKLRYLATRKTKYTNKKVLLFVGVPAEYMNNAKLLIDFLEEDLKRNIKIFPIIEKPLAVRRSSRGAMKILFS